MPVPTNLQTFSDSESLSQAACEHFIDAVTDALQTQPRFRVSLSGGSTPKRLYQLLAQRDLPWDRIDWFWGDERNVTADHDDSNFRMVRETLLRVVGVPAETIFAVPVDPADPAATAATYEQTLRKAFAGDAFPQWDLALQGMGDDAHTASLFPETTAITETERWFVENWVEKLDTFRYTLTAPAINSARQIWFFISGAAKRPALASVWNGPVDPAIYPSQLISPDHPGLKWYVTTDAMA